MYKNGFGSKIQTQTQTQPQTQPQPPPPPPPFASNTFSGTYNTCSTKTINLSNTDDDMMFAVVTGNITNVKRLVNSSNINNIIDKKNNYRALHHAVRIKKNDSIVEYLLSCGANPSLKQDEGKDAIDLTIEANYRYLIDKMLKDKEKELDNLYTKFDDINYKVKGFEKNNQELIKTNQELIKKNEYLIKSSDQYVGKIEELKTENSNLKRKFDDSEKAFSNLLKKTKK